MAGLPHPLLQMGKIELRVIGGIPDKVVPIPPFYPVLPLAQKQCMHLAGERLGSVLSSFTRRER